MNALFIILFLAFGTAYSQCMDSLWRYAPNMAGGDWISSIIRTQDGNGIIAGYKDFSTDPWYAMGTLQKLDPATGDMIWSHDFVNLGSQDVFLDVHQAAGGGFICAGWSRTPVSLIQNYWLLRTDSNGDSVWSKTYSAGLTMQGRCVAAIPGSGYGIAGRAHSLPGGFGNHDWLLIKTNANGDSLWSVIIGDSLEDTCNDIIVSQNGEFILLGTSLTDTSREGRIAAVNQSGQVLWNRVYSFEISVDIQSAFELPDGGYWVCGWTTPPDADNQVLLMEIDANGIERWHHTIDLLPERNETAFAIESDDAGGAYIFGMGYPVSNQNADGFVVHVSSCGEQVSTRWIGDDNNENVRDGTLLAGGELALVGAVTLGTNLDELIYGLSADTCNAPPCSFTRVTPQDSTMPDYNYPFYLTWNRSHDSEGSEIQYIFDLETTYPEGMVESPLHWVTTDTAYDLVLLIPVSPLDEIFDFHWRVWATDGQDTIEASNGQGFFQLDIIMDADEFIPYPSSLILSAAPNPFNPTTTLSFTLTQSSLVQLNLFDIQGRLVQSLANNVMTAGSHSITVDGTSLASGIYFANLRANNQSRIAKLVLMK